MVLHEMFVNCLFDSRIPELFTFDGFRRLICLIALNGQGIGTSSLEEYEKYLWNLVEQGSTVPKSAFEQLEAFDEAIEEVSGSFVCAEGSGLYKLHSKINHVISISINVRAVIQMQLLFSKKTLR
jgi:hypothetical protein